jgi:3-hydroxyisobutyrate dehydrogenase-like beta-hydroxyacid dehydrogenase
MVRQQKDAGMTVPNTPNITLLGFGEASDAFATGWGPALAPWLCAYDIKALQAEMTARAAARGLVCHARPQDALTGADVALCLVTADQALAAAQTCAPHLPPGVIWLDGNSCAPSTKRRAEKVIEAAGGRYVDMAIMAPVHPALHRTHALLSGPHGAAAVAALAGLDMSLTLAGDAVGDASTIKMLRSVMVKGFEALTAECLLAARRAGVEDAVVDSLQASDPGWNIGQRGSYNLERMLVHGARRAAEMREVALTLRDLGLPDRMAAAAADWQDDLGGLGVAAGADDLQRRLDAVLDRLP